MLPPLHAEGGRRSTAETYVGDLAANADFRKFDDGLRMTLDCSADFADALEARLAAAADYADYGTLPPVGGAGHLLRAVDQDRGHLHFVDGAGGGYAAASAMKARRLLKGSGGARRPRTSVPWISRPPPSRAARRAAKVAAWTPPAPFPKAASRRLSA